jgi:NADH:ubiquinone oxidoreductase subunit 4 (subunit M)
MKLKPARCEVNFIVCHITRRVSCKHPVWQISLQASWSWQVKLKWHISNNGSSLQRFSWLNELLCPLLLIGNVVWITISWNSNNESVGYVGVTKIQRIWAQRYSHWEKDLCGEGATDH